ncbi:MAG TPA: phosphotransferase family protein [Pyrinomonadaceae bacterium]|nr:phosphotransferase family protein [Pyrinomonadaceae bacterium]
MNENLIDRPRPTRPGEELDTDKLFEYLVSNIKELTGPLVVQQFPSGFSNLTYLIRVGDRELVLRRPPVGAKIKSAHDMGREYKILSHLHPVYPKVPRPLLFCEDLSVLGVPFYVMERVRGVILRAQLPPGVVLTSDVMRKLSDSFVRSLVEIHAVDCEAAGLSDLGLVTGYVKRQVSGWTRRYYNARTDDVPEINRLAKWLGDNLPADAQTGALIHNDYKYDNLVLSPNDISQVVAVLDWEMATIGDPLMDLGTTLGYWVDGDDSAEWKRYAFGITSMPGSFSRAELLEQYQKLSGRDVSNSVFYYAYGLLKIAVIVQQIYFRFRQGFTKDQRFAQLDKLVSACGKMAQRAIDLRRIDRLS